jgi:hypothetical protein
MMAIGNWDLHADGSGARNQSGYVTGRVLSAAAESMAIPSGAKRVIIANTAAICFSFTGTAVVPADDDTGVKSEILVPNLPVDSRTFTVPVGATNLSVIAADGGAALVTASWFY